MKRNFLFIGIFVACIATVSAYNVMLSISKSKHAMQLVSLSAFADSENGTGSENSGAGITTQSECQANGGYWNMASICAGGGVNSVICAIGGEITFVGVTIFKAELKKGTTYNIVWERWMCTLAPGNCCIASSQGVLIKNVF
jgi:hypothetical protein